LLSRDIGSIAEYIREHYKADHIDGIFLDHDHSKFFTDLNILREKNLLKTGTVIVADNAFRHKQVMSQFIDFVRKHSKEFELENVSDPYPDQVLCSVWDGGRNDRDEL
jgi:predicted O-methyltransferase YrrM